MGNLIYMIHKYKIKELVTNIPGIAEYNDQNLYGPGGIAVDNKNTLWVANTGNDTNIKQTVTHYDLYGVKLSEPLPFIDYESPDPLIKPSEQRNLISDLFWLQKNILKSRNVIMSIPTFYVRAPIIGIPARQPSRDEISLNRFMNAPNGYLGSNVNISFLINFCINNPLPITNTVAGRNATRLLARAHTQVYPKLLLNPNNLGLKTEYANLLMGAQTWIAFISPRSRSINDRNIIQEPVQTTSSMEMRLPNDTLPIGICYNQSRGFVGFPFNGKRCSCDLIAVTGRGTIYVYSPLIHTDDFYGMISVLNNSSGYCVYTGVSMTNNTIYIADFANQRIDAYDFGWTNLREITERFIDPDLPKDYTPFNVYADKSKIYVLYAKIDTSSDLPYRKTLVGEGLGIINVFTLEGEFIKRAVTGGKLNAPWGFTKVKHQFVEGKFIIGNHGDGLVLVYDSEWNYMGKLSFRRREDRIMGLYSLVSVHESVFFTSALNGVVSGVVGKIDKICDCKACCRDCKCECKCTCKICKPRCKNNQTNCTCSCSGSSNCYCKGNGSSGSGCSIGSSSVVSTYCESLCAKRPQSVQKLSYCISDAKRIPPSAPSYWK